MTELFDSGWHSTGLKGVLVLFLASCGPINFETPDLLTGCVKATAGFEAAFPGWRQELEIAAERSGIDVYPSNNPTCPNALDVTSQGFTAQGIARADGDLSTRFRIYVHAANLDQVVESSEPCSEQFWLSALLEGQLRGLEDNSTTDVVPVCGPWSEPNDGGAP